MGAGLIARSVWPLECPTTVHVGALKVHHQSHRVSSDHRVPVESLETVTGQTLDGHSTLGTR